MAQASGRRVHRNRGEFYQGLIDALVEGARLEFRRDEIVYDARNNAEKTEDRERRLVEHDETWPPEIVGYLWNWFQELSDWRVSGFGVGPLSHLEIECWARLVGVSPPISPHEVVALRRMDRELRSYHAEKDEKPKRGIGESLLEVKAAAEEARSERGRASAKKRK